MIVLPNGCRRSEFHVFPANWKTSKAKLTDFWYADCRFIDPRFMEQYPKGKPIRIKGGINRLKTIQDRRDLLVQLINEMEGRFKTGYNPITETKPSPPCYESIIGGNKRISRMILALTEQQNAASIHKTIVDIKSVINTLETTIKSLEQLLSKE